MLPVPWHTRAPGGPSPSEHRGLPAAPARLDKLVIPHLAAAAPLRLLSHDGSAVRGKSQAESLKKKTSYFGQLLPHRKQKLELSFSNLGLTRLISPGARGGFVSPRS